MQPSKNEPIGWLALLMLGAAIFLWILSFGPISRGLHIDGVLLLLGAITLGVAFVVLMAGGIPDLKVSLLTALVLVAAVIIRFAVP